MKQLNTLNRAYEQKRGPVREALSSLPLFPDTPSTDPTPP